MTGFLVAPFLRNDFKTYMCVTYFPILGQEQQKERKEKKEPEMVPA
jgi:hypothetical protein